MGGSIGFGIRWNDNGTMREVYMDRWTNDLPWRICHPEFINQGTELKALVEEAKPGNEWPHSVLLTHIERCEYGLILVDFPTMEIYSRNDYCTAMRMTVSPISSAADDEMTILNHHIKNKSVKDIEWYPCWDDLPAKIMVGSKAWEKHGHRFVENGRGFLIGHFNSFKVDAQSERYPPRKEVAAWLKSHGWKTPMKGRWKPS